MSTRGILRWLSRRGVRRSRLKGTFIHRLFGKAIFARDLWAFNKRSVGRGWMIGCLAACNPFMGLQIVLSLPFVLVFRGNLFVTIALVMVTNPLTIVPFLIAALKIGTRFTGMKPSSAAVGQLSELGMWAAFKRAMLDVNFSTTFLNTMIGCLVLGLLSGLTGWLAIQFLWRERPRPLPPASPTSA